MDSQYSRPTKTSLSQLRTAGRHAPRIFILVLAIVAAAWLWPFLLQTNVERHFIAEIKRNVVAETSEFPVANTTEFQWDKVCFFYGMGESSIADVLADAEVAIPLEYQGAIRKAEDTSDTRLYIFSLSGTVVEAVFIPNTHIKANGKSYRLEAGETICYGPKANIQISKDSTLRLANPN